MESIELPVSDKVVRLETEIAIYIPSTQGIKAQKIITEKEMNLRTSAVQRFLYHFQIPVRVYSVVVIVQILGPQNISLEIELRK